MNNKKTEKNMTQKASQTLRDKNSSKIQRQLAGSVLSQSNTNKQTGKNIETKASKVLKSDKYNKDTKSLAVSVLSQSDKDR